MIDFIIGLALKLGVFVTCLFALCFMAYYLRLYVVCDKVVRSVEVSGLVDSTTYDLADTLTGDYLTVNTNVSATYFDAAQTEIQLRSVFTITLTSSYKIRVATPLSGGNAVYLTLPMTVSIQGMSEKFWR